MSTSKSSKAGRVLYKKMSSLVENSTFDALKGQDVGSIRSIHSNMVAVVPSGGLTESFRISARLSIRDVETLKEIPPERHMISFVIIYTMIFFNGCCFTAVVPSVPFYLQILGAPPSFLGWVVSFYSVGQLIGSPIAGQLTGRFTSKTLLTCSSTLGIISSVLYAAAPNHWLILLSRLLTGISAGWEFTTELAYIARNTTTLERTTFLASVTAVNVVGFIMGPALTTILARLDFTIFGLVINQYTGPGWLLVIMFFVDLCMVQTMFKEDVSEKSKSSTHDDIALEELDASCKEEEEEEEEEVPTETSRLMEKIKGKKPGYGNATAKEESYPSPSAPLPSITVVASLIFVQFTVMCAWSVLETITSPLAHDSFEWNVQHCNYLFTAGGFVSLLAYFGFVVASKWVQDRWLIAGALVVCFIGLMLMIDWEQFAWFPESISLPPYLNRFLIGYMVMNAGFMTGRPVTFALYSKLIASEYQGQYLGWMVAGGSAARTLGPFGAVYLYYGIKGDGNNMLALFGSEGIFQLMCLVFVIALWRHLLPVSSPK